MERTAGNSMEYSSGTVLYTVVDGEIYYVLVRSPGGSFGFPKGHIENGETETQTARRETLEESGIRARIDAEFCRKETYHLPNGNLKTVTYFAASYADQTPRIDPEFEIGEIIVIPYERALSELRFENAREILREANEYILNKLGLKEGKNEV